MTDAAITAGRLCKTCRHLKARTSTPLNGDMHDAPIAYKVCGFPVPRPWAFAFWHPPTPAIGNRHYDPEWCANNPVDPAIEATIGSDWTEAMDCPTWDAKQ